MADAVKIVVVDGVRYRKEDAPDQAETEDEPTRDPSVKQRKTVRNKARTAEDTDNK